MYTIYIYRKYAIRKHSFNVRIYHKERNFTIMGMTMVHCDLTQIDSDGNEIKVRPQIDGNDVAINANRYGSGASAQTLVDALKKIAFDKSFKGIKDTAGDGDTNHILSINKIKSLTNSANQSANYIKTNYAGWFGENTPATKPSV
jgi:hypothetical protein